MFLTCDVDGGKTLGELSIQDTQACDLLLLPCIYMASLVFDQC